MHFTYGGVNHGFKESSSKEESSPKEEGSFKEEGSSPKEKGCGQEGSSKEEGGSPKEKGCCQEESCASCNVERSFAVNKMPVKGLLFLCFTLENTTHRDVLVSREAGCRKRPVFNSETGGTPGSPFHPHTHSLNLPDNPEMPLPLPWAPAPPPAPGHRRRHDCGNETG